MAKRRFGASADTLLRFKADDGIAEAGLMALLLQTDPDLFH
jgi:hypothetical protein